ncbi:outer membrane protein assembly factor [Bacteroidales bacterium OttesenSCG-928-B11]|nr:outer membrane protein assembly factor [Bacteroidales bacterium OttesenSCG-928-B11]
MKNNIEVKDKKSNEFDDLQYLVRPTPNRKFLFTNLRTAIYVNWEPKVKRNGETKERWLKRKIGEPPVLLDTSQIDYSVGQLHLQLRKLGYFTPEIMPEIRHRKSNPKKVLVDYKINVKDQHYVREVNYTIPLPEFRRIILLDTASSLLKPGMAYNENRIIEERNRIASLIRDNGYYYVNNNVVVVEVDTINSSQILTNKGQKSLALNIVVDLDHVRNENLRNRMFYRYQFDKIYIHTNYSLTTEQNELLDTIRVVSYTKEKDSTTYYFITPADTLKDGRRKIIRDFRYRTIIDNIFTKKGAQYTQAAYNKSYYRLRGLNNFSIINIEFIENQNSIDSVGKTGKLDTRYRLTRSKKHSFALEGSARSDKMNLSFSYSNRNLFKGAEYFTVNLYTGFYYHNVFYNKNSDDENLFYFDVGANASLSFPRLLFFKNVQNSNAVKYSTQIRLGVNVNQKYKRTKVNFSTTYNWTPNNSVTHSFSPVNINTYDTSFRVSSINEYSADYRKRFDKAMDLNIAYRLNYLFPINSQRHNLRLTLDMVSSGLLFLGVDQLFKKDSYERIFGYRYTRYESLSFNLNYLYTINKKNAIASRLAMGAAIPLTNPEKTGNVLPFENGFAVGGANSIRGWGYRLLGPGGYSNDTAYMEKTGDIMLELNLEYRGTIWKALKYGVFADAGNIWLWNDDPEMPNAKFGFDTFYKQLALSVGVGLRLDFNFFLIRIDYGLPILDPGSPYGNVINSEWFKKREKYATPGGKNKSYLGFWRGFQIAIGHAF